MVIIAFVTAWGLAVIYSAYSFSSSEPTLKPPPYALFPVPAGHLVYRTKTSGNIENSMRVATLRWLDFGRQFRLDSGLTSTPNGPAVEDKEWTICDGKAVYVSWSSHDAMQLQATSFLKRGIIGLMLHQGLVPSKLIGHAVLLGKPCEVRLSEARDPRIRSQDSLKLWLWDMLPLRAESRSEFLGDKIPADTTVKERKGIFTISLVVTSLNTNFRPSSALFRVPAGYKIHPIPAP